MVRGLPNRGDKGRGNTKSHPGVQTERQKIETNPQESEMRNIKSKGMKRSERSGHSKANVNEAALREESKR